MVKMSATSLKSSIRAALAKVYDPELNKSLTELGMIRSVEITSDGKVTIGVDLTTAACPLRTEIVQRVRTAVFDIPGVIDIDVQFGVMSDEQRTALRKMLRGSNHEAVVPFAQPQSHTRVFVVASGKGGVGKSTVTVNLAAEFTRRGLNVGIVDADIYGHSIPQLLGTTAQPVQVDKMIIPPIAQGIKVISIAQFTKGNSPVIWRGPMLHRALQQFLTDVFWGDLDVLFVDLPPGTGDIAISIAQLIPSSEIIIVTTPQITASFVAERAGSLAVHTRQKVVGVVENMSFLRLDDGSVINVFGSGGGQEVADSLSGILGVKVPLLGNIPLNPQLGSAADKGILANDAVPDSEATKIFAHIADTLIVRKRSLAGMQLGIITN